MNHLPRIILLAIIVALTASRAWAQEQGGVDKFPVSGEPQVQAPSAPVEEVVGSLAVQALQGTPGAEPIGAVEVTIQLYHRAVLYDTIETQLDAFGVVVIDDLPMNLSVQPVVQIVYKDMTYQKTGTVMDAAHPHQTVQVTCYEATDTPPQWKITMRHVMIAPMQQGIFVKEVVVIENPGERTWMGSPTSNEKKVTTAFALPRGAKDITLGKGFHDWCCSTFADGTLSNHLPLMPNTTELNFDYFVPATNGSVDLEISAPVSVDNLMIAVPEEMATGAIEGVQERGTQQMGKQPVRYYMTSNQQPGQSARLSLTGLATANAVAPAAIATDGTVGLAKVVAAIGGGLFLLIAIVLIFSRSSK